MTLFTTVSSSRTRLRAVSKDVVRQMVINAVSEINVTFAFETRVGGEFWGVLAKRLKQMNNIFAANEHILTARYEVHRNVNLVKPVKVVWWVT